MPGSVAAEDRRQWPEPLPLALRAAAVIPLLLAAGWHFLPTLAEAVLPVFAAFLDLLDNRLLITDLSVGHIGGDRRSVPELVFRLEATVVRPIVIGHRVLAPVAGGWLASSTPAGSLLQPLILGYGLLLVWPAAHWRTLLVRLLLALPLFGLLLVLDVPLLLWAYIWDAPLQHFSADTFSPLLAWARFMMNGGRLLLALLLAIGIIATIHPHQKKGPPVGEPEGPQTPA